MKYFKTHAEFLTEAKRGTILKAAKKGSYPVTVVVISNGSVAKQEIVNTPTAVPAVFNELQKEYPGATINIESMTGETLFVEAMITEAKFNKKSLIKTMKKDDGFIQLGNGQEYVIYAYDNGNDDNDDMWGDKTIFALDQDGGEHEIKYSDIVSYNEGRKINLKQAHLSSSEYQMAKKLKDFDKDDWEWNPKTDLYDKLNESKQYKAGDTVELKTGETVEINQVVKGPKPELNTYRTKVKGKQIDFSLTDINESVVTEGKFDDILDLVKSLHFEIDPDVAEEMKIELGKRQGEINVRKQLEGGEYSLRRFRKEIKYDTTGKDLGVFRPGSYMAATSKLGDGPHKKAAKKVRWNQKMYDQWIEDVASNDGWKNAYDMAQNAKQESGLIDWVKKNNRGEDPMQRIQWDIEAHAE